MPQKQHFCIAVKALLVGGGRALLLRRGPTDPHSPGTWDLPGGRLEFGESPKQALAREIEEETGLAPAIGRILYSEPYFPSPQRQFINIIYLCRVDAPGPVRLSNEHVDYLWASRAQLEALLQPDILRDIQANHAIDQPDVALTSK